jgi:hypothetical protein
VNGPLTNAALIAAAVSGAVSLISLAVNAFLATKLHTKRIETDRDLATAKNTADLALASRKVVLDQELDLWKRRVQFAEDTLSQFYEAKTNFASIRSPLAFGAEALKREGRDEEDPLARQIRDIYYPHLARLVHDDEFFSALHARRFRAIALFGVGADEEFLSLRDVWSRVLVSTQTLMRPDTHVQRRAAIEHKERLEALLWGGLEGDAIAVEIDQIIEAVERRLRPALTSPQQFHK